MCNPLQFRFTTPMERALLICGILLSIVHGFMIPTLFFIFGMALQHFADHYNTNRYFYCISDENINCSIVQYCSTASNQTDCCMDDTAECITNHTLLDKLDIITVLCVAIAIVTLASSWIHASIFHYLGNNQMTRIRKKLFQALISQDIKWFDVNESKEITSRMIE